MKLSLATLLVVSMLGGCATAPDCPQPSEVPAAPAPEADAPAVVAAEPAEAPGPATVIVFVRHAEKASDGTPDPPLTERGQRRAECLATLLGPFEADVVLHSEYQRTRNTVKPLSDALGVNPTVIEAGNLQAWKDALNTVPPGSHVVVSGHSNTIPAWVQALGAKLPGLDEHGNIPHDDYDRMVQVVLDGEGQLLTSYTTAYCTEPAG
ncbi:MAG: histidine phosphatase family protein [Myxococcota bacterium]